MKIRHKVVVIGNERSSYQKLLEHLRYSNSRLISWEHNENITAICLFEGTKYAFEMAKRRAHSFQGIEIKKPYE